MKKLMITALMMFTANAFATDAYDFKNLGFSADGRYYAFVQSVMQDGSGFPSAKGQVIDVARNQTVEIEHVVLQDDTAQLKTAVKEVMARMNLRHYGIDGKNRGETLWVRLPTDLSPATQQALFSTYYGVDGGASSVWPKMQLNLIERDAPKSTQECWGTDQSKMITLSLASLGTNTSRDLQVDTRVPSNRACSWGYQIREVISFKGAIAAVLRYEQFGFEGPDYTHMVVTGANAIKN